MPVEAPALTPALRASRTMADGVRMKTLVTDHERMRAEVESLWQRLGGL
jgi:hypothetical protein